MQINISTRHGHLSEGAQGKITEKVEKIGKFIERITHIDVVVDLEKADHPSVEILVQTEHKGKEFKASHESNELFGSVDQAMDKIVQQIKKFKEKLTSHHEHS